MIHLYREYYRHYIKQIPINLSIKPQYLIITDLDFNVKDFSKSSVIDDDEDVSRSYLGQSVKKFVDFDEKINSSIWNKLLNLGDTDKVNIAARFKLHSTYELYEVNISTFYLHGKKWIQFHLIDSFYLEPSNKERFLLCSAIIERIKEMSCVYCISQFLSSTETGLDRLIRELVEMLPYSFYFPRITKVSIQINDISYTSSGYSDEIRSIEARINTPHFSGQLRVGLQADIEFLEEEHLLINNIKWYVEQYIMNRYLINGLKEKTKKLEEALLEVNHKTDSLHTISYNQSHIFRAPVARILGIIQLLESTEILPENIPLFIDSMKSSVSELDVLIRDFSKLIDDKT